MNTQRWHPHTSEYVGAGRRLQVGDVIGFDHAAWRVEHVQDAVATGEEQASLEGASAPIRWPGVGPYNFTVRRLHGPPHRAERKEPGLAAFRKNRGYGSWWTLYPDGRVPLCSCCGDPWPCRMLEAERYAHQEGQLLNELSTRVETGACFGCGKPVTTRQATIQYPEGNLRVPLAPPPVFHARESCRDEVVEYERLRSRVLPEAAPMVHVHTYAVLRDNDGRLVEHDPESFHAAWHRAVALGEIDEDGRDPATGSRWASADGRRDMWRTGGTRPCGCGRGPVAYVGGNRGQGLTWGCRACIEGWVEHGYRS